MKKARSYRLRVKDARSLIRDDHSHKIWCKKNDCYAYFYRSKPNLPEMCGGCRSACPINDFPFYLDFIKWVLACPYNNDVAFFFGIEVGVGVKRFPPKLYEAIKRIYAMPPEVVHCFRDDFVRSKKGKISERQYIDFVDGLTKLAKEQLPFFDEKLPHWKNGRMMGSLDKNYFFKYCKAMCRANSYSQSKGWWQ